MLLRAHIFYTDNITKTKEALPVTPVLKIILFISASAVICGMVFKPLILPKCGCCGRVKFRTYFRYHTPISMRLSRKGDISLCRDCCDKYNIRSISDFKKRSEIRKRMEYKNLYL